MKKTLLLFVILLSILSCGNSEKSSTEKKGKSLSKSTAQSPCELLTETEIKKALSIPVDTKTSMKDKSTNFPSCFYKWESITWPYKVIGNQMAEYHAELSIVLVANVNKEQYETSVSFYKDGEEEAGIGDMATWSKKRSQLTSLYKGKLFHVHARTSADAASNKAKAIHLAKLIVKKL
ncbi:hypothetical protein KCTC52924_00426 [Arenibacter antarcticus]|uniref:DUF3558 domain-containing protein n=1 Tax=Arenibacter antarcticus TaxID=2040469 RepID=A0ABW5VBA5_9FLAO|nr:hypothetical protein [Arenibacter sp. H213]MCM4169393.1 hypothetical protein [Arenibacter sp. H213]